MTDPSSLDEAWAILAQADRRPGQIRTEATGTSIATGPVLAGLDAAGSRHLLIPVAPGRRVQEDSRSAGVQIRYQPLDDPDGGRADYADVICLVPRLNDVFASLAAEMIDVLKTADQPVAECQAVLDQWRELLERGRPNELGPNQLAGLFGELLVLRDLISLDDARRTDAWMGPTGGEHDFARGASAIEVKTSTVREGRVVEIHGAGQLEAPSGGELHLAFIRLDVRTDGVSVPSLIDEIVGLGASRLELLNQLARVGYDPTDPAVYDYPRFSTKERRLYLVDEEFPRVVGASFVDGSVPAGVMRLRYHIDITGDPPTPLDAAGERELLGALAAG